MRNRVESIVMDVTEKELREFALSFEEKITNPLMKAGFDKYNIFDILNIGRQELRHSDFLAFLFDCNKSGEIGRQFLRNFLVVLADERSEIGLDFFEMLYGDIDNVRVMREASAGGNSRIDIFITFTIVSRSIAKDMVIVIENKVDSGENGNQLFVYGEYLRKKYAESKATIIKLFLSPDCLKPSENDWIAIGYDLIYQTLCRLNTENTDNTVRMLVDNYKDKIRREFDMNNKDDMQNVAITIYEKNKNVLDYIFKCMPKRVDIMADILRNKLRKKGAKSEKGGEISNRQNTNITFITERIAIDKYKNFYFQINVAQMYFLFVNADNRQAAPLKWFYEDGKTTESKIEYLDNNVTDEQKLENECDFIINKIFDSKGFIDCCIDEYEQKSAKK